MSTTTNTVSTPSALTRLYERLDVDCTRTGTELEIRRDSVAEDFRAAREMMRKARRAEK